MHYILNSFFDKEEWKSLEVKWSLSTDGIYEDTAVLIALERFYLSWDFECMFQSNCNQLLKMLEFFISLRYGYYDN